MRILRDGAARLAAQLGSGRRLADGRRIPGALVGPDRPRGQRLLQPDLIPPFAAQVAHVVHQLADEKESVAALVARALVLCQVKRALFRRAEGPALYLG